MRKPLKVSRAFTLIELLVVIAIISILAAVLFPVFATAREKARQTQCSSNAKQLSLAWIQYVQDYDELVPCGAPMTIPNGGIMMHGLAWGSQLYPYVKSKGVYTCPDDDTKVTGSKTECSYAMNTNTAVNINSGYRIGNVASTFLAPAMSVLLFESKGAIVNDITTVYYSNVALQQGYEAGNYYSGNWGTPVGNGYWVFDNTQQGSRAFLATVCQTGWIGNLGATSCAAYDGVGSYVFAPGGGNGVYTGSASQDGVHSGGSVYAFCDGHVKWLKGTAVSAGATALTQTADEDDTGKYAAGTQSTNTKWAGTFSIR